MSHFREYVCIVCPNGCPLKAELSGGTPEELLSVKGNLCPRGITWVRQEIENPMRTISTSVLVKGGDLPLVSVRTADPVPLKSVIAVREALRGVVLEAPLHVGDVVMSDPAGCHSRIIVTRNIARKEA